MSRFHQEGLLDLRFRCDPEGRTYLADRRQRFPLRMTVPLYLDPGDYGMAFVYVQNPTGGVFAGDRLETRLAAGAGARVHLTTQSATKLYRMEGGEAIQELRFALDVGAYVEHMPDSLIPQAGTRFSQTTIVELAPGASFLGSETLAPGRRARGERFEYDRILLRSEVRRDGRELCVDTTHLEPARRSPQRRGLLGQRDYLASLLVVSPERDAARLATQLDRAVTAAPEALGAAGVLPGAAGAVVRILASSVLAARHALTRAWQAAREELVGLPLPPTRK